MSRQTINAFRPMSLKSNPASVQTPDGSARGQRLLRLSWVFVALIPVTFVAAIFIGEGLISLQGYGSATDRLPPVRSTLIAAVPAVLLMLAPAFAAIVLGFRARRQGAGNGIIPAVIGVVIAAYVILTNSLQWLLGV